MVAEAIEKRMKKDFSFLIDNDLVLGILLYGSAAKNEQTERSDIDVCVVAPEVDDKVRFSRSIMAQMKDDRYDVRLFELLPLYLKMEVIEDGKVIHARNMYELYEYFFSFRKLWDDQKERQTLSKEEALRLFAPPT
jgi:hypothetical protein